MQRSVRPSRNASAGAGRAFTAFRRSRRLVDGWPGERDEAGPEARLEGPASLRLGCYQLPLLGQAPLPVVVQLRVTLPAESRAITNELPEADVEVIVYASEARPLSAVVVVPLPNAPAGTCSLDCRYAAVHTE